MVIIIANLVEPINIVLWVATEKYFRSIDLVPEPCAEAVREAGGRCYILHDCSKACTSQV